MWVSAHKVIHSRLDHRTAKDRRENTGGLLMLLLDYVKASDGVKSSSSSRALARFGLPLVVSDMISGMCSKRYLSVLNNTGTCMNTQYAGIAQNCRLSPCLFIAVQSTRSFDVCTVVCLHVETEFVVTWGALHVGERASNGDIHPPEERQRAVTFF